MNGSYSIIGTTSIPLEPKIKFIALKILDPNILIYIYIFKRIVNNYNNIIIG